MIPNPEDSWAQVELYIWQHGKLPTDGNEKELQVDVALEKMAAAIQEGCMKKDMSIMPSPVVVCEVLKYISRIIKQQREQQNQKKIIV